MARVFISYRRDDAAGHAGRLYDRLGERFGRENIYRDVDNIRAGEDFLSAIRETIAKADVLLALIGRRWLTATDDAGRWRLANPDDVVRQEISAALERRVRVIPVLLDGAKMVRPTDLPGELATLARLNAVEIRDGHFDQDVAQLLAEVGRPPWLHRLKRMSGYGAATVLIATTLLAGW
jgi:hypothetical protein